MKESNFWAQLLRFQLPWDDFDLYKIVAWGMHVFMIMSRNARIPFCVLAEWQDASNVQCPVRSAQNSSSIALLTRQKVWFLEWPSFQIKRVLVQWDGCFYFMTDHIWNIKVILAYMQTSAGVQISAWHRISDLIFSACCCLGCLARSLLQSCFISSLRIWSVWFFFYPPSSSIH